MTRKHITARLKKLDPVKDHQEIARLLTNYAFPWDINRALELALFRTFAVPSISKLLSRTGEFKNRPRKRYDDTELVLAEIAEHGYDSERAKQAFRRLNKMHGAYNISNEDFLYVLSTFIFVPMRWLQQFGWRPLSDHEKLATFIYYKEVGKRMGIKDIPESLPEMEAYNLEYEQKHFVFKDSNREIGDYTVNLLLGFYLPNWLFWMGRPIVYSLMDDSLIKAMGFQKSSKLLQSIVFGTMKLRANIVRFLPERKKPFLFTKKKRPTYPEGYKIEELGTFPTKESN